MNAKARTPIPVAVCLADVTPCAVRWLWEQRIPMGRLTVLVGDPTAGKSFLTHDIAARVSRGHAFPDGAENPIGPASVVMLNAEDAADDTIRPRIDAHDGDVDKIFLLSGVEDEGSAEARHFNLAGDLAALEALIVETGARLVIIDPLTAYLGTRVDSYRDADVRGLLTPLGTLADRRDVAVLAVMHLGKDAGRRALYRTNGSIAFTAAPRAVWAVGRDPRDERRRVLACVKLNIAEPAAPLAYRIIDGVLAWDAEPVTGIDADRLLGPTEAPDAAEERGVAEQLLSELLSDGPIAAGQVFASARQAGVPEKTLRKAAKRMGVNRRKVGRPGQPDAHWEWSLPANMPANMPKMPKMPYSRKRASSESSDIFEDDGRTGEPDDLPAGAPFDGRPTKLIQFRAPDALDRRVLGDLAEGGAR